MNESTPTKGNQSDLQIVSEEQDTLDGIMQEDLSPEDRAAGEQLRSEVNQHAREAALPEGRALHRDVRGDAMTVEEWENERNRREDGESPEYGQGGTR